MNTHNFGSSLEGDGSTRAGTALGSTVYDIIRDVHRDVEYAVLPLPVRGVAEARASRERLLSQLNEHILPRLKELSSPAMVVIAGSTGAGKSTLYNSLLGHEISEASVLRPTTREPVLAYHPDDIDVFVPGPAASLSRVIQDLGVPRGTALVDAPDLDSLLAENREIAAMLLDAADLWLFVTTAARYGDALPWQTLARAKERGASVAMVLNRVPDVNMPTIRSDLLNRLRANGFDDAPLFIIPDAGPHEGLLPKAQVAPISRWLTMLAGPDRSKTVIVRTLKGSLSALPEWVAGISAALDQQVSAAAGIRDALRQCEADVELTIAEPFHTGRVVHGAVTSRWTQLTAERIDRVSIRGGRVRSTVRKGRLRSQALEALHSDVVAAVRQALVAVGVATYAAIREALVGQQLDGAANLVPTPSEASSTREELAHHEADSWAAGAMDYVGQAQDSAAVAAVKAFGHRGLAAVLMAGALGLEEARELACGVLPAEGSSVMDALRDDVIQRASRMVRAEGAPVWSVVHDHSLSEDAGVGLQLRLAELRRLL